MRKTITAAFAALTMFIGISLAPASVSFTTPAEAQQRHYPHGGVVPGSPDDQRFVPRRGWVPNHPRHHRSHVAPTHHRPAFVNNPRGYNRPLVNNNPRGHNRATTTNRTKQRSVATKTWQKVTVTKKTVVGPTRQVRKWVGRIRVNLTTGEETWVSRR